MKRDILIVNVTLDISESELRQLIEDIHAPKIADKYCVFIKHPAMDFTDIQRLVSPETITHITLEEFKEMAK